MNTIVMGSIIYNKRRRWVSHRIDNLLYFCAPMSRPTGGFLHWLESRRPNHICDYLCSHVRNYQIPK